MVQTGNLVISRSAIMLRESRLFQCSTQPLTKAPRTRCTNDTGHNEHSSVANTLYGNLPSIFWRYYSIPSQHAGSLSLHPTQTKKRRWHAACRNRFDTTSIITTYKNFYFYKSIENATSNLLQTYNHCSCWLPTTIQYQHLLHYSAARLLLNCR